ncbi:hypothetical protein CsatB_004990 [Cannabis sativa]
MNIEVEAISVEIIKPSSPTPKNLGLYKLSLIDQSAPLFYDPLVFYYTMKSTTRFTDTRYSVQLISIWITDVA